MSTGRATGSIKSLKGKALGRRLFAFAFDNFFTLVLAFGFLAAAHFMVGMPLPLFEKAPEGLPQGPSLWQMVTALLVLRFLLDGCYQVGYLVLTGRTPGLGLLGLRVKGEGFAEHPTLAQALTRWAWSYALTLGVCWGALSVRRDRWGRSLHDLKAGSRIVPA